MPTLKTRIGNISLYVHGNKSCGSKTKRVIRFLKWLASVSAFCQWIILFNTALGILMDSTNNTSFNH